MSEVQPSARGAASRGRGSGRGGRGGFAGRGGRAPRTGANGDKENHKPLDGDVANAGVGGAFDDEQPELAQLRKQYGSKTGLIRELFPDWSEVDVLFALQETEGDENLTVTRIAEGMFFCLALSPSLAACPTCHRRLRRWPVASAPGLPSPQLAAV